MQPSRPEICMLMALAATIAGLGWWLICQKPNEPDPLVANEYHFYVQKSPEHQFAAENLNECSVKPFASVRDCGYMTIGKATYERGGDFGLGVMNALKDIGTHMEAWKKDRARQIEQKP